MLNFCETPVSTDDVMAFVLDRVRRQEPASLVRFSHCEAKFLIHPVNVTRKDVSRSLKRQFGYTDIGAEGVDAISAMVKTSAASCDVAGVPFFTDKAEKLLAEGDEGWRLWSLVKPAADRLRIFRQETLFADVNIHTRMARNAFLDRILETTRTVTLVGCRDLREPFRRLGFEEVYHIPVPEAARTRGDTVVRPHYPDAYRDIVAQIRAEQRPGLFLVGAGFLGKAYCHEIRLAGGVAVDIGSVMDLWAGVASRNGHEKVIDQFVLS